MKKGFGLLFFLYMWTTGWCQQVEGEKWVLILHQPGKEEQVIFDLPPNIFASVEMTRTIDNITITLQVNAKLNYSVFKATMSTAHQETRAYLSLCCRYSKGISYNFNGEVNSAEIFRQSPHDVNAWIVKNIAEQSIPVIAVKSDKGFTIAVNSRPADYENFTSQYFYPHERKAGIASGDNGSSPGLQPDTSTNVKMDYNADKTQIFSPGKVLAHYPRITPTVPHYFEGIIIRSRALTVNNLRRDINYYTALHFSGGKIDNHFGALAFTTAYMNTRVNETGKSKYWVVPSVEYGNTQYCRDAFWISTMLPPEIAKECLMNELQEVNTYAEYPLMAIIWAYTAFKAHFSIPLDKVQLYVDAIEERAKDGFFYSFTEKDGRLDFQYWGDVMAFEKEDVITYNQGMFALALLAAKDMGLRYSTDPNKAVLNYQQMFNPTLGFFPMSKKKNTILGPDPLVPDLLANLYFNQALLNDKEVKQHYQKIIRYSKTKFGYKIVSMPDGKYLDRALYDIPGYVSQINREKVADGSYFSGGSFFLYDNLFLMDAYWHGVKEAEEELIWRVSLDFNIGSTTYECLNTKTGEPWKPNMGWNIAVYAFWKKIQEMKKADDKLFREIDRIMKK